MATLYQLYHQCCFGHVVVANATAIGIRHRDHRYYETIGVTASTTVPATVAAAASTTVAEAAIVATTTTTFTNTTTTAIN